MNRTQEEAFWPHVQKSNGCWNYIGGQCSQGYRMFRYHGALISAHRYSYELANGPIPEGMNVCHRCDNPSCVRPDHLFLGDDSANIQDMLSKGRGRGQHPVSRHFRASNLTQRETEVLILLANGQTNQEIGSKLGISIKTAEKHRDSLYRKVNTSSAVMLTHFAISTGLVPLLSPN